MSKQLQDIRVLITRPEQQSENLCRLIEELGGIPIRLPTVETVSHGDRSIVKNTLETVNNFQWIVFISQNAVNFALTAIDGKITIFDGMRIVAIGSATARALENAGIQATLTPDHGFDSESLLAMPQLQNIAGQRILIVRGLGGREKLANVLRNRGALVDYLEVYRRIIPKIDCSTTRDLLTHNRLNVIMVASVETLDNLLSMIGADYLGQLLRVPLIAGSPRIADAAAHKGFVTIQTSDNPTDAAMIKTLITWITGEQRGRS